MFNKVQIINTDFRSTGISSLAPEDRIAKVFGLHPVTTKDLNKVLEILAKADDKTLIVLDTLDGLFWQIKEDVLNGKIKASQNEWDVLLNLTMKLVNAIGKCGWFIATCHVRQIGDGSYEPFLQGTFKDQIGGVFDVIMMSKAAMAKDGMKFSFQLLPTGAIDTRWLPGMEGIADVVGSVPQNWEKIITWCRANGYENLKFLVLGGYGTGKTYSLRTLKPLLKEETNVQPQNQ